MLGDAGYGPRGPSSRPTKRLLSMASGGASDHLWRSSRVQGMGRQRNGQEFRQWSCHAEPGGKAGVRCAGDFGGGWHEGGRLG